MKFFHLSDLHIGKTLHHYSMKEEQEAVLSEIIDYAASVRPDAVVIAGDIYDRSAPSAESVAVFDWFLTRLSEIKPVIPVMIISGNHDSTERLEYVSGILKKHQIYVAGSAPRDESERLRKITLEDVHGTVDFYLLPFLKPSYVRKVFEGEPLETYTDAVGRLLEREEIDYQNQRNVLVSHQFYTGKNALFTCDSETFSVGGIENVDVGVVKDFDYVALGHLHGPQNVSDSHIRYCGTLLKYSVSESVHEKSLTVVTLGEKGKEPQIELLPLHPLRDVKRKAGSLKDIVDQAADNERGDYVSILLTDEVEPYRPKEQLEKVFDHILEVRVDNSRTRNKLLELDEELIMKDPVESFADFYREMQGKTLGEEEFQIMLEVFEKVKEE